MTKQQPVSQILKQQERVCAVYVPKKEKKKKCCSINPSLRQLLVIRYISHVLLENKTVFVLFSPASTTLHNVDHNRLVVCLSSSWLIPHPQVFSRLSSSTN